jgi:hypothetical protein
MSNLPEFPDEITALADKPEPLAVRYARWSVWLTLGAVVLGGLGSYWRQEWLVGLALLLGGGNGMLAMILWRKQQYDALRQKSDDR